MEVGAEVYSSREDTLAFLTFRLSVELLPPFVHEVKLGLEVHQDLNLLTLLIQSVTYGCVLGADILAERNTGRCCLFHVCSTLY